MIPDVTVAYLWKSRRFKTTGKTYACQWRCSDGSTYATLESMKPSCPKVQWQWGIAKKMYWSTWHYVRWEDQLDLLQKDWECSRFLPIPLCILFIGVIPAQGVDADIRCEIRSALRSKLLWIRDSLYSLAHWCAFVRHLPKSDGAVYGRLWTPDFRRCGGKLFRNPEGHLPDWEPSLKWSLESSITNCWSALFSILQEKTTNRTLEAVKAGWP